MGGLSHKPATILRAMGGLHVRSVGRVLKPDASGAMQHITAPPLGHTGHIGQLVNQPGGHQEPPCLDAGPVAQRHPEATMIVRAVQALGRGDDTADDPCVGWLPVPPQLSVIMRRPAQEGLWEAGHGV